MVKKILLFWCLSFFAYVITKAQSPVYTYYLDDHLSSIEKDKAVILGKGTKEADKFKLDCFLITTKTLVLQAHFTDSTLATFDGMYTNFYINGKPETQGNYVNGALEGLFQKWNRAGQKTDSIIYRQDKIIANATFSYYSNGNINEMTFEDSLQDTYNSIAYNENGTVNNEAAFKGQKGILKTYKDGAVKTDTVLSREERDAQFPGGAVAWRNFLTKNMNPMILEDNKAPNGTYEVVVKFIVKSDGTLADIEVESNPGYGTAQEAIRLIKLSPDWIPASKFGHNVDAYRRQPISFSINN